MSQMDTTPHSRVANRAGFFSMIPLLKSEGAGNAGRIKRTRSLARKAKKRTSVVTASFAENVRHSPREWF
jgi:hypothetical protein